MCSLPPYLTDAEIADICRPLKQGAAQMRRLKDLGIKARRRADGSPLVWRADVERPSPDGDRATVKASNQPNWTRRA